MPHSQDELDMRQEKGPRRAAAQGAGSLAGPQALPHQTGVPVAATQAGRRSHDFDWLIIQVAPALLVALCWEAEAPRPER